MIEIIIALLSFIQCESSSGNPPVAWSNQALLSETGAKSFPVTNN
jgi:hypothetical protein